MRAIFFGTPDFAVPALEALLDVADVVRVITQPDRPAGRGMKLAPPPVKVLALARGLEVTQPTKVRTPEFAGELAALEVDVALVVAYGRILPRAVLDAPRRGCVNVHASLLPRWRGAAPIQWAVAAGDPRTGVTLMQMDEGMDTGPMLATREVAIGDGETAGELAIRLARLGGDLVRSELSRYVAGTLAPRPQPNEGATHAPMLTKEHGALDFGRDAASLDAHVRGMSPWPGAYLELSGARWKVLRAHVATREGVLGAPGTVLASRGELVVACARGALALDTVQLVGKRAMPVRDALAGHPVREGTLVG